MVSVAFGVNATPVHRCCTRNSRRHPKRASLRPEHRLGSHCSKSHMASGGAENVDDDDRAPSPFASSSPSSSSSLAACLRSQFPSTHEHNAPPPPRAQSGNTERPPRPEPPPRRPGPPPRRPGPRFPRPRAMRVERSTDASSPPPVASRPVPSRPLLCVHFSLFHTPGPRTSISEPSIDGRFMSAIFLYFSTPRAPYFHL